MGLQNPVNDLPLHLVVAGWVTLALITVLYATFLKSQGAPLVPTLPHGIVSLEVPWSSDEASTLVNGLETNGLMAVARRQVQLDFVFLVLYPLCLALGAFLLARVLHPDLAPYGLLVAWAVLLCAPLDAAENLAMLAMLDGRTSAPWPQLSTVCASVKFALVLGALSFILIGALAWGWRCFQKLC